jgi:type II secretory pathway pseudopilin PulG
MARGSREAGFTLLEVTIATGIGGLLTLVFATTFATSSGLWGRSTVSLRVHEEHRRNLDALANAFRGAAASSLSGFDANNNATEPSWQCVIGIDENGLVLDEVRSISWRATSEQVEGVESPGELVLTQGVTQRVVARRVPEGGFRATLLGNMLRFSVTTYSTGTNHQLSLLTGDNALKLRN